MPSSRVLKEAMRSKGKGGSGGSKTYRATTGTRSHKSKTAPYIDPSGVIPVSRPEKLGR